MNRIIASALVLSGMTANAQVGINTDNPKATLHVVSKDPNLKSEGIVFPHATQQQINSWASLGGLEIGTVVYNTDQRCLEFWDGTQWVNQCGGRSVTPPGPPVLPPGIITPPAPPATLPSLPPGLVLGDSGYYIASIYDENYLPYSVNTGAAALGASNPDNYDVSHGIAGTNPFRSENYIINLPGNLDHNGIEVSIPIKSASVGEGVSITIPSFSVYSQVRAEMTRNNQVTDVELYFPGETFNYGRNGTDRKTFLKAILRAKDPAKPLLVKQLDMNIGNGYDYRGIPLAEFKYFSNDSKTNQKTFYFNAVTGIPDRNFDEPQGVNSGSFSGRYMHRFIYVPAYGLDGRVWLSNNLGADYANVDKAAAGLFNPGKQAETPSDMHAYGSLFLWGRVAPSNIGMLGHELINWNSPSASPLNVRTIPSLVWAGNSSTVSSQMNIFWEYCPLGFKTPAIHDWDIYLYALGGVLSGGYVFAGNAVYQEKSLRMSLIGQSDGDNTANLTNQGIEGLYNVPGNYGGGLVYKNFFGFGVTHARSGGGNYKTSGYAVRCLKN